MISRKMQKKKKNYENNNKNTKNCLRNSDCDKNYNDIDQYLSLTRLKNTNVSKKIRENFV